MSFNTASNGRSAMSDNLPPARRVPQRTQLLITALEGMRSRLATLATSINDYLNLLGAHPTMPPYNVVQTRAANIAAAMTAVSDHLAQHHSIFIEADVFPLPKFPLQTELAHNALSMLLRKKLDPAVEDWIVGGRMLGKGVLRVERTVLEGTEEMGVPVVVSEEVNGEGGRRTFAEWNEFWGGRSKDEGNFREWDGMWGGMSREFKRMGASLAGEFAVVDYTREEREMGVENVKTGLKRELRKEPITAADDEEGSDDDDSGEDDDDEEKMAVDPAPSEQPAMEINVYLRYMNTGILPENISQASANANLNVVAV